MAEDIGAIVGGCVAGGIILILVIGITVYFLFCKKKHRKRRDHNKFHPISSHTSPAHSQPSTLGPDGRLPKVNSTGLWMGAPSMYTGTTPSPAYYFGPNKQAAPPIGFIPRASSETRIHNNGYPYTPSQAIYGSHGSLIMMKTRYAPPPPLRRAASAPKVPYGGMQPRIYHSSQPLAPVFEVPHPQSSNNPGLGIYDVYQFAGGNSRSKLVEAKHSNYYYDEGIKPSSKLARSQSDAQDKTKSLARSRSSNSSKPAPKVNRSSSKEAKHHRPPPPPPHHRSSSKDIRIVPASPHRNSKQTKSLDSLDGSGHSSSGHFNQAFDAGSSRVSSLHGEIILRPAPAASKVFIVAADPVSSSPHLHNSVNGKVSSIVPDHTNNREIHPSATDSMKLLEKNKTDDQKRVVSPSNIILSSKDDNANIVEDKDMSEGHVHYYYQGDIYAVPGKDADGTGENPILSRMKKMVIEKSHSGSTKSLSPRDQQEDRDLGKSASSSVVDGNLGEYQEIGSIEKENNADVSLPDTGFGSAATQKSIDSTNSVLDTTDGLDTLAVPYSPVKHRDNISLGGGSDVTDVTSEDMNSAGKRVTDSAFEFLNTYLSDEEGEQVDSPPISP